MNRLKLKNKLIFAFLSVLTVCSFGCSSVHKVDELKAFIDKTHEISLMSPGFSRASYKELLNFEYQDRKESLIILAKFDEDGIRLTGLTPNYINLFTIDYKKDYLNADAKIPLKFLPPVNQVLLDILLCHSQADAVREKLPYGYSFIEEVNDRFSRKLYNADNKLIYKIDFSKINNIFLPSAIYNYTFEYTIRIKYL